jgi:hypothetical protein
MLIATRDYSGMVPAASGQAPGRRIQKVTMVWSWIPLYIRRAWPEAAWTNQRRPRTRAVSRGPRRLRSGGAPSTTMPRASRSAF